MSGVRSAPAATRWALLDWPGWARLALLAAFFALVNWMIFAPASSFKDVHEFLEHQDKIAHGAIFLALACLTRWSLPGAAARGRGDAWLRYAAPAALVLYASSAELLQPLLGGEGRTFEWLDLAFNVCGSAAGWLFFGVALAREGDCPARACPARSTG